MASCECCWAESRLDVGDYSKTMRRHEDMGCVCTKNTPEGRRARAGQFWDEALQRDRREVAAEEDRKP